MAASAARPAPRMGEHVEPINLGIDIADNVVVFSGTMVGLDAAGNARPAGALSATPFVVGISEATVDNTVAGHAAGKFKVPVRQGTFRLLNSADAEALSAAHVGKPCYAVDDQTVSNSSSNGTRPVAGIVAAVDAAGVHVTIGSAHVALAELVKYLTNPLADPGHGVAIPVTRSAEVNMTIAAGQAETNTLAVPTFAGQRLILNAEAVGAGGTRAVTAAQAINQAANTVMTFAAVRDCIELVAIKVGGALRWQVALNDGVALS